MVSKKRDQQWRGFLEFSPNHTAAVLGSQFCILLNCFAVSITGKGSRWRMASTSMDTTESRVATSTTMALMISIFAQPRLIGFLTAEMRNIGRHYGKIRTGILENTAVTLFADFDNNSLVRTLSLCARERAAFIYQQGMESFSRNPKRFAFAATVHGKIYDCDGWLDIYFCLTATGHN